MAGVSWFLARVLLASKFHVKYVVVSSDPEKGYNFSEGTSLSEVLIVAKRKEYHTDNDETIFINLLRKPSTALEAIMLVEEIRKRSFPTALALIEIGRCRAIVLRVKRKDLLSNVDNWNKFVAIPDPLLTKTLIQELLINNTIKLEENNVRIPMVRLNNIISSIGIDRHQFHDNFKVTNVKTLYPVVFGGEEKLRSKILVKSNAYAYPKTSRADAIFKSRSARILVPDRIWWDTTHVISLYATEPTLSNMFYAVRLDVKDEVRELAEKALVLWLNTTWGFLTVLFNREETRGRWTSLKMSQWRLLPVLDVTSLDHEILKRLAIIFDKYADKVPRRIPEQFNPNKPDPIRLEIDKEFIKTFAPSIDDGIIKHELRELYRRIHVALGLWMRE